MTEKKFNIGLAREITAKIKFGQIKTRDGQPARIVHWNAKGEKPIVVLIDNGVNEFARTYTTDGKYDTRENVTTNFDLIIETEGGEV